MEQVISITITQVNANTTVYHYLKMEQLSSTFIRQLKREGRIRINHLPVRVDELLQSGDLLELVLPQESTEQLDAQQIAFAILYEDEHILVVDKPAGIAVHPTFNYASGTLANGIVHYWNSLGKKHRFRAINRLDKDTSGIVLIALNLYAYNRLSIQQQTKQLVKKYIAYVHGKLIDDQGNIDLPIGRKDHSIIEREVRSDGQQAITQYKVIEQIDSISALEIQLITGRTHQIRVHMSHIGHPLLGDDLYGGQRDLILRQALHAHHLTFMHPLTGTRMTIEAPIPSDMTQVFRGIC